MISFSSKVHTIQNSNTMQLWSHMAIVYDEFSHEFNRFHHNCIKNGYSAPISISLILCLLCHAHPLPDFFLLLIPHSVTMPNHYEPSSYTELLAIPEFTECREIFLRAGWGPFLASLQGHDDGISLQFSLGFDGRLARIGSLVFLVSEESIASATKLPRVGDRWFKHHQLPHPSYNRVFKPEFQNVSGAKGYSKEWIKDELINPLIVITRLITCEGRYSVFKACHFRLLAHFQFNKPLNFPFYFLKILEKMSSQVHKNLANPHNSLFHHGLIKFLVISELTK
jgi:hypothetical protein